MAGRSGQQYVQRRCVALRFLSVQPIGFVGGREERCARLARLLQAKDNGVSRSSILGARGLAGVTF
jgi:hypothetical protein